MHPQIGICCGVNSHPRWALGCENITSLSSSTFVSGPKNSHPVCNPRRNPYLKIRPITESKTQSKREKENRVGSFTSLFQFRSCAPGEWSCIWIVLARVEFKYLVLQDAQTIAQQHWVSSLSHSQNVVKSGVHDDDFPWISTRAAGTAPANPGGLGVGDEEDQKSIRAASLFVVI